MGSGRTRLIEAARTLLAKHPDREPSTREIYDLSGVAAPTLYHHFGDKDGLMQVVAEQAFAAYLARKQAAPRTGHLLADFEAGWRAHVSFGVENPVLYGLMFGPGERSRTAATDQAETEVRRFVERMVDAGVLRVSVDQAVAVSIAMAIGCVAQLTRNGKSEPDEATVRSVYAAMISELAGQPVSGSDADQAARSLLAQLDTLPGLFSRPESGLLAQWLKAIVEHVANSPSLQQAQDGIEKKERRHD